MKKYSFLISLLSFVFCLKSQVNLVMNPDFVLYDTCPDSYAQLSRAKYWISPTTGTPEFYNQCCPWGSLYVGVPWNNLGYQDAVNSDGGYVGIVAIEPGSSNYREY